jgi:hypothetical protein
VSDYAVRIARSTRAWPGLSAGASPRGGIALVRAARAHALIQGRDFVTPDDVKAVALPALRHRIMSSPELELRTRHRRVLKGLTRSKPAQVIPSPGSFGPAAPRRDLDAVSICGTSFLVAGAAFGAWHARCLAGLRLPRRRPAGPGSLRSMWLECLRVANTAAMRVRLSSRPPSAELRGEGCRGLSSGARDGPSSPITYAGGAGGEFGAARSAILPRLWR